MTQTARRSLNEFIARLPRVAPPADADAAGFIAEACDNALGCPEPLIRKAECMAAMEEYGLKVGGSRDARAVSIERIVLSPARIVLHCTSEDWSGCPDVPRQAPLLPDFAPRYDDFTTTLPLPLTDCGPEPLTVVQWEAWEAICERLVWQAFGQGANGVDVTLAGEARNIIEIEMEG